MPEPKIGETRRINQGKYKENQIFVECPLCHKTRWTEMRNGVARYPICKHHKPTPQTEQAKKNNSIGLKKSYLDPIKKASHALGQKKRYERQEERDKQSERITLFIQNHPEYLKQKSLKSIEVFKNPDTIAKLCASHSRVWQDPILQEKQRQIQNKLWQNSEYANRMLDRIAKGNTHKQTKHEKVMELILNEYFPEQWKYTGDRKIRIGRKYPDFVHNNGSNLLIECFGDYWHGAARSKKLRYDQTVQGRIELFAQYGYKTLVLWEHEILKLPKQHIAERVKVFMDNNKRSGF